MDVRYAGAGTGRLVRAERRSPAKGAVALGRKEPAGWVARRAGHREDGSRHMKLIVGLGNPGRKYQGTRHNVGFDVLDQVARQQASPRSRSKFDGQVVELDLEGERVLLLWPQTYMNLSGGSVGKAYDYFHLDAEDLLVVCDDFSLPLGKLRFRPRGSAGGQKGLADVIRRLGTQELSRLRIGIGPVPERWEAVDFVLSRFTRHEGAEIERVVGRAAEAVVTWIREGTASCMNRYN